MQQLYIHLMLEIKQTLQEEYIFNFMHLVQEKGQQLNRAAIIIQTNPFLIQQEYNNITLLSDRIIAII